MTRANKIAIVAAAIGALGAVTAAVLPLILNQGGRSPGPQAPQPHSFMYSGNVCSIIKGERRYIANAEVQIVGHPEITRRLTDVNGFFSMEVSDEMKGKTVDVAISSEGYKPITQTQTLSALGSNWQPFVMEEKDSGVKTEKKSAPPTMPRDTKWVGLVTDDGGLSLEGAQVTLLCQTAIKTATTLSSGEFIVSCGEPVQNPRLSVAKSGFEIWDHYITNDGGAIRIVLKRANR